MQYTTLVSALLLAASSQAASLDSSQLDFLTRFVSDAKAHTSEYLAYVKTADADIPADFTSLAKQVFATTGNGYTSAIASDKVATLESFASGLPWYSSRLADSGSGSSESGASQSGSSSSSSSTSGSSSSSSSTGGAANMVLPAGAGMAALAVALL